MFLLCPISKLTRTSRSTSRFVACFIQSHYHLLILIVVVAAALSMWPVHPTDLSPENLLFFSRRRQLMGAYTCINICERAHTRAFHAYRHIHSKDADIPTDPRRQSPELKGPGRRSRKDHERSELFVQFSDESPSCVARPVASPAQSAFLAFSPRIFACY